METVKRHREKIESNVITKTWKKSFIKTWFSTSRELYSSALENKIINNNNKIETINKQLKKGSRNEKTFRNIGS